MENSREFEKFFRTNLMIWIAFFNSLVVYVFMMELVVFKTEYQVVKNDLMFYIFLAIGISEIVLIPFVKQYFLNKKHNENTFGKEELMDKLSKLRTGYLIGLVMAETPCLMGFVLGFITHSRFYFYTLAVISFIAMILNFPNKNKWKEIASDSLMQH